MIAQILRFKPKPMLDNASFLRVLGAIIYDTLIVFAIVFVAAQWFPLIPETLQAELGVRMLKQVYVLSICFFYFAYSWRRGGQTIGMKSWRVKIIQANQTTSIPSWKQCIVRFGIAIVSWGAAGLGFLWMLLIPAHLSWHDMASHTRLIVVAKANMAS